MSNTYFQFKQFIVRQDWCAMKVGTDGVLVGAWTDCSGAKTILDVGTGSGLIALMLAQRSDALIDAIDMDENACRQAGINIEGSPFASRLRVVHQDLLQYFPGKPYDLIVSNPPYFAHSLKSPDLRRTAARHTDTLSLENLLAKSYQLLSPAGRLSLILPAGNFDEVQTIATRVGFYLTRKTAVSAVEHRPPKRVLLEYAKTAAPLTEDDFFIETADRTYSARYVELTKAYYLKM
ncbi:MAG: methyltransferase [Dysgonamonadaceae bacterium]|jgi:tRNA1Val (adenine37-N6)-methyltransferase|nr:methyltransferase [Dysgonamonadaceae bacterium]